jgi:ATP-binding protein involved in chromosome partitioning
LAELLKINLDYSCLEVCENCPRYFICNDPRKKNIYKKGRMLKTQDNLEKIKYKIGILSGKGGVGKSTVTVNIAEVLANRGKKVSIIDSDFDAPCIPKIMGITDKKLMIEKKGIIPVVGPLGIKVVSMGFMLNDGEVITWFHESMRNALEEFLSHVIWDELDYMLIDLPPGTGSASLNVMQYIRDLDGVVVVTIPSEVSQGVAKRAIAQCMQANVKVLGVVENMSGFVCPKCNDEVNILKVGGGERLAQEMNVPFLGKIPLDPIICDASDEGISMIINYPDSFTIKRYEEIVENIKEELDTD